MIAGSLGHCGGQEESHVDASFLKGMIELSQSREQVAVWHKILQGAMRGVGECRFTEPLPVWESRLRVLDLLTCVPPLQYCLVPPVFPCTRESSDSLFKTAPVLRCMGCQSICWFAQALSQHHPSPCILTCSAALWP